MKNIYAIFPVVLQLLCQLASVLLTMEVYLFVYSQEQHQFQLIAYSNRFKNFFRTFFKTVRNRRRAASAKKLCLAKSSQVFNHFSAHNQTKTCYQNELRVKLFRKNETFDQHLTLSNSPETLSNSVDVPSVCISITIFILIEN